MISRHPMPDEIQLPAAESAVSDPSQARARLPYEAAPDRLAA